MQSQSPAKKTSEIAKSLGIEGASLAPPTGAAGAGENKSETSDVTVVSESDSQARRDKYLSALKAQGYLETNSDEKNDSNVAYQKRFISEALRLHQDDKDINEKVFQTLMKEWVDKQLLDVSQVKMLFEIATNRGSAMTVCDFLLTKLWLGDPSHSSIATPPADMAVEFLHYALFFGSLKSTPFFSLLSRFQAAQKIKLNNQPILRLNEGSFRSDDVVEDKEYFHRNIVFSVAGENGIDHVVLLRFMDGLLQVAEPAPRQKYRRRDVKCKDPSSDIRSAIAAELKQWQPKWDEKKKSKLGSRGPGRVLRGMF